MSDSDPLLSALGISVDDLDAPDQAWSDALGAAFDPATAPVAGDVVPLMDDEPRVPGDEIDLGDDDLAATDDGIEPIDHGAPDLDDRTDDDLEPEDPGPLDTGHHPEQLHHDLGLDLDDDGPSDL